LPSYNALDVAAFRHFRISHSKSFVKGQTHINGIENFWNQAKRHLRKYNGIPQRHFNLFLKEYEWWFNTHSPQKILKELKGWLKEGKPIGDLLCQSLVFRFNQRTSKVRGLLCQRVLENSMRVESTPYYEIIARKS